MGLRLFQDDPTIEEARDAAHALVSNLKACCLLLDGKSNESFRIHDVIRDFAISKASSGELDFLVRHEAGPIKWPSNDTLKTCTGLSLVSTDIEELPDGLDLKLQIFLWECDSDSINIPSNFFKGMKELKVLVMSDMSIPSIPTSIQFLRELRTLCLERCELKDASIIGQLKNLEILSFIGSDVGELPKEVGQLAHLKVLDFSNCGWLVIPPNVISSLSRLECLYMMNTYLAVEAQDTEGCNSILAELKLVSSLRSLEINIPDVQDFPIDLLFQKLTRFKISTCSYFSDGEDKGIYSKTLKLKIDEGLTLQDGVNMLMKRAQHLIFEEVFPEVLKSVLCDLEREGFKNLKCLEVNGCNEIEYLVGTTGSMLRSSIFPILEKLRMRCMGNLKEIFHCNIPTGSFRELRELSLSSLHELKNVFPQHTARDLGQLQKLSVSFCSVLEEIFANDKGGGGAAAARADEIVLPNLISMTLEHLPNIRSFYLETNGSLFSSKVVFPALEELELWRLDNVKELYHRQLSAENFCRLRAVRITECNSLVKVFPSNLPKRMFQNLETLRIEFCKSVEEVCELKGIFVEEEEGQNATSVPLPGIRDLRLRELPRLKHMWWNNGPLGFRCLQNLTSLSIFDCGGLRSFFSISASKGLVQLQTLEIGLCEMMEKIITAIERGVEEEEGIHTIVFPQLRTLKLKHMSKLTSFYQGNCTLEWPSLKAVMIEDCPNLKTFAVASGIGQTEDEEDGNLDDAVIQGPFFNKKVLFPTLETLEIDGLNCLKELWNNYQLPADSSSFSQLRQLRVKDCKNLVKVIPLNLVPRLQNLQELSVTKCYSVEEVLDEQGGEYSGDQAVFPQLHSLILEYLPRLSSFCKGNYTLRWPSLTKMVLENCPNMHTLSLGPTITPNLNAVIVNQRHELWKGDLKSTILHLFVVKVFPSSEELVLEYIDNVKKEIWDQQLYAEYFCRLRKVTIKKCRSLVTVFPSNLLPRLQNLEELAIESCDLVEEVCELEGLVVEEEGEVPLPGIRDLKLLYLTLKHMWWNNGPLGFRSLQNLTSLYIVDCGDLRSLFSVSASKGLVQLQTLEIRSCDMMEKIITAIERGVEEEEDIGTIVFPQLRTLKLVYMSKLTGFYQGKCTLDWPSLKELMIERCPRLKTFAAASGIGQTADEEEGNLGGAIIQGPIFNEKLKNRKVEMAKWSEWDSFPNTFSSCSST